MSKKGYEVGGPNVFGDIGVSNPEEHLIRTEVVFKIRTIMRRRGMTQARAAATLGVAQPDVSKMVRGEVRQFSVERLLRFPVALNQDVRIVVRPHRDGTNAAALHIS